MSNLMKQFDGHRLSAKELECIRGGMSGKRNSVANTLDPQMCKPILKFGKEVFKAIVANETAKEATETWKNRPKGTTQEDI